MTKTITKPIAKDATLTAKLSYQSDDETLDMPETIVLELTDEEVGAIQEARTLMARNAHIHTVNVCCTPPEMDGWRYDVCYLAVHQTVGCYLFLQGKYDCSEQVEYSVDL